MLTKYKVKYNNVSSIKDFEEATTTSQDIMDAVYDDLHSERSPIVNKRKIEKLYELLERAEDENDVDAVAALRWAIFQLEQM